MASEEGLKILLNAEVQGFLKDMKAGEAAVMDVAAAATKSAKSFDKLSTSAKRVANDLDTETQAIRRAAQTVEDLGKRHVSIDEISDALKTLNREASRSDSFSVLREYNKDISLLENEIKRLQGVGKVSVNIDKSNQFSLFAKEIEKSQAALKQFVAAAKNSSFQFNSLSQIPRNAAQSFDVFQKQAARTGSVMISLSRIVQDAPFGYIAIQNNITELFSSYQALTKQLGSSQAAFKAAASSLIGAGGIGVAFSAITSLITLVVQKYGSLSAAIDSLVAPLSEAAKRQKLLNETINQGHKDAQQEVVEVDKLYRAATNLNIPLAERQKIVNELQKKYPAYFKSLSDEAILAGKAADEYKRLRDEIIAVATTKAIDKELEKQGGLMVDLVIKQKQLQKEWDKSKDRLAGAESELENFNKDLTKGKALDRLTLAEKYAELQARVAGATKAVDIAHDAFYDNEKIIYDVKNAQNELLDVQDSLIQKYGAQAAGVEEVTEKSRTAADVLADLKRELGVVNAQFKTVDFSLDSINNKKISALNKAFEDLIKLGLKPTSPEIKKIVSEIEQLNAAIIGAETLNTKILQQSPEAIKRNEKQGLDTGLPFVGIPNLQSIGQASAAFSAKMAKMALDAKEAFRKNFIVWGNALTSGLEPAIVNLGAILQQGLSGAFAAVGEGLGEAIAGGGLSDVLGGIISTMSDFIITFGKQLIEAGTLALIAQKSIIANPYLAIAAGIGAVAIGTALKNKIPAFATGGTVSGPTLAMIGDNPSGVEHVIPQEVLDRLGGGNGFIAETRLSGSDILVVVKRAGLNQNRING